MAHHYTVQQDIVLFAVLFLALFVPLLTYSLLAESSHVKVPPARAEDTPTGMEQNITRG